MSIKEYFQISFQKPEMSQEQVALGEKKNQIKLRLENAYDRLESIELLISNSKNMDSSFIAKVFYLDLINIALFVENKNDINDIKEALPAIERLEDSHTQTILKNESLFDKLLNPSNLNEKDFEYIEENCSKALYQLEKKVHELFKTNYQIPLEQYKKRIKVQSVALSLLLLLGIGIPTYKQVTKPKPLKQDNVQIYFMNVSSPNPTEERSIKLPLTLEPKWTNYKFKLQKEEDITSVQIIPIKQKNAKIQIRSIKFLDKAGKVIKERDFVLSANGIISNIEQVSGINQVVPANNIPNTPMMVKTTGINPNITLNMGTIPMAAEIELEMRQIEAHKNFADK